MYSMQILAICMFQFKFSISTMIDILQDTIGEDFIKFQANQH